MTNRIAIIPARAGSKGLPNKNVLMLIDKPLIAYTIEAAKESQCFNKIIVSTDSLEYKSIAERYGAEVIIRSEELASDTATTYMVIENVLSHNKDCDYFMLLQPTSPFRNAHHIKEAITLFEGDVEANFLVSMTESEISSDLMKTLDSSMRLSNFNNDYSGYRRQDNQKEYSPNGAIFIGTVEEYLKKKHFFGADSLAYIMNKADSIDIDDRLDFEFAISRMLQKNKNKIDKEAVARRIKQKFSITHAIKPITLIGHSIFDNWELYDLAGKEVNNYGVSGITSEDYYNLILDANLIKEIGDVVFLMLGTNDIVIQGWDENDTLRWLMKIIDKIVKLNPNVIIYFLSLPPVNGRVDRNNKVIEHLNAFLFKGLDKINHVRWVSLSDMFYDDFGNLSADFTYDGLHFNGKAYRQLKKELMELIK